MVVAGGPFNGERKLAELGSGWMGSGSEGNGWGSFEDYLGDCAEGVRVVVANCCVLDFLQRFYLLVLEGGSDQTQKLLLSA
jgi:hypothetical protein